MSTNFYRRKVIPDVNRTCGGVIDVTLDELYAIYPRCLGGDSLGGYDLQSIHRATQDWTRLDDGSWRYEGLYSRGGLALLRPLAARGMALTERAASNSGRTRQLAFSVRLDGDPREWARGLPARVEARRKAADARVTAQRQAAADRRAAEDAERAKVREEWVSAMNILQARCAALGVSVGITSYSYDPETGLAVCGDTIAELHVTWRVPTRWVPNAVVPPPEAVDLLRAAGIPVREPKEAR